MPVKRGQSDSLHRVAAGHAWWHSAKCKSSLLSPFPCREKRGHWSGLLCTSPPQMQLSSFSKKFLSVVDLQCCINFKCTTKWINYACTYIHSFFFKILFPYRPLQSTEQSSPCYTVGSYYLFYTQQCVYANPNFPIYPFPLYPLVTISLFSTSMTILLFCKWVHWYPCFFRFHI